VLAESLDPINLSTSVIPILWGALDHSESGNQNFLAKPKPRPSFYGNISYQDIHLHFYTITCIILIMTTPIKCVDGDFIL